jgi:hypothetical protein
LIKEEKILRQQKSRLEARMAILEDHNRQLEAQLDRLRQLLATETGLTGNTGRENGTNGTLQSRSHFALKGPKHDQIECGFFYIIPTSMGW